ncbi:MAG TPA: alpha-amylase family glycosyl hydrolase [Aggregatilineales bacterium]|nr:alpha-amylase [Anaerolineales bacterium]HRE47027.1 alpha-amylase family glycosyl hydrolase [Aggregatilineales bacterium]
MSEKQWLWWQTGVIYQIYPRSFMDSNKDGIGDIPGIISRLDYLKRLGIDAIWLSPFYPSPQADFGYDVADYCDVDPQFGTLADFDRLVDEAHKRDLRIVVDYVPNHSSDQHPWFLESRQSRTNPKADWYVWADPKADGSPPNNWLGHFGGSAWDYAPERGQFYLHSFLKEQPDLNWRNPAVKEAMLNALRFWLERGVDGFRIDVAHFIMKDPEMRDNPLNPTAEGNPYKPLGEYDSLIHLYDKGHPDVHAVYREMRALLDSYSAKRPRYSVGEIHIFDWDEWAQYYGKNLDELHMPFNFGLVNIDWKASAVRTMVDSVEGALKRLNPDAWSNYVLGNHDEHRIASRRGVGQARMAMTLLLTLRGTPTIYYGDELGMLDGVIPPEKEQDPWGLRMPGLGLGRDPERTPMQWDTSPNAGFTAPEADPWLPTSPNTGTISVAAQEGDDRSMLTLTKTLLSLRRGSEALTKGVYTPLDGLPDGVFGYLRAYGEERRLILLNFTGEDVAINLPAFPTAALILSSFLDRKEGAVDLTVFALRGDEGVILTV